MRIVRANPSWAARATFVAIGAAAFVGTLLCLHSTVRGAEGPWATDLPAIRR